MMLGKQAAKELEVYLGFGQGHVLGDSIPEILKVSGRHPCNSGNNLKRRFRRDLVLAMHPIVEANVRANTPKVRLTSNLQLIEVQIRKTTLYIYN